MCIMARSDSRICDVRGCPNKHGYKWSGREKVYSRFCQEHTCQWRYNTTDPFCPTQRDRTLKCCPAHGKCRVQGCIRQAPRDIDANNLPWICSPREYILYCPTTLLPVPFSVLSITYC